MATLCTEIGMPKYRENKKKWKSFLPGNIPANICHRQCLVCEGVCVLYSRCHQRVWAVYSLPNVRKYIFMLCESVYIRVPIQQTCVLMWFSLNVCGSMHSRTRVLVFFFMYIQYLLSSFPAHFVCARERAQSCAHASVCEASPSVLMHTSKASSSTPYLCVGLHVLTCMCVCVHSSMLLRWAMTAVASSPCSPPFCL